MYESFFQLSGKPFDLVPNPASLFLSSAHRKALNYLTYGIRQQSGFILLTGEVGTGKTTLIRRLIKSQLTDVTLSKIFNTKVSSQQLLEMILEDFGVHPAAKDKPSLLRDLNDFLIEQYAQGRQCVLIVDEAQNLTHELLEEVRLLSNLENDQHKLLRIILAGQPELKALLASPELLQLRQRIQVSCHIPPLPQEEVSDYVLHRLEVAGNREAATFGEGTFEAIHRYTKGVPRLINILCDYLFLDAFANETREITAAAVHEVAGDLNFDGQYWNPAPPAGAGETVPGAAGSQSPPDATVTSAAPGEAAPGSGGTGLAAEAPGQDGEEILRQLAGFQGALGERLDGMWEEIRKLSDEVSELRGRIEDQGIQDQALFATGQGAGPDGRNVAGKIIGFLKNFNGRLKTIEEILPRLDARHRETEADQEPVRRQLAEILETMGGRFDSMWQAVGQLSGDVHALKDRLEEQAEQASPAPSDLNADTRRPSRDWVSWLIFWIF